MLVIALHVLVSLLRVRQGRQFRTNGSVGLDRTFRPVAAEEGAKEKQEKKATNSRHADLQVKNGYSVRKRNDGAPDVLEIARITAASHTLYTKNEGKKTVFSIVTP